MPTIEIRSEYGKDFQGDVVIVPVFAGRERHRLPQAISRVVHRVIDEGDFRPDPMAKMPLHRPNGVKGCRWMLLLGLGREADVKPHRIRKAFGMALRTALQCGWTRVGVLVPSTAGLDADVLQRAVLEGALLADYDFTQFKGRPEPKRLAALTLFANGEDTRKLRRHQAFLEAGVRACHRVRDLVNTPPGHLHPEAFAALAQRWATQHHLRCEVLDPPALLKGGFNCVLAVGRGSARAPRVVTLEHRPTRHPKRRVVLVGKGVCFDAGGLSLKDATNMETMKDDMAGAAIVLATLVACAELKLPVQVTGILGLVENMPSGSSYKPGDVLKSRSGKTIEVLNTDAEGRLVLADLLHWACESDPDHVVDLATLTGACMVALGDSVSGVFGTDSRLVDRLVEAGEDVGEALWPLPLVEDYREGLKSTVADLKNITGTRWGGAISAALFLQEFVKPETSWAHVDLSGAWSSRERDFRPAGGTGEGPRWLLEWLRSL